VHLRGERRTYRRRESQCAGGPHLEEVEAVVAPREAVLGEGPAEVRLEAAQHDVLAGLKGGDDLCTLARRELDAGELLRGLEQPAVGRDQIEPPVVTQAEVVDRAFEALSNRRRMRSWRTSRYGS
jgi:hypothetical protein